MKKGKVILSILGYCLLMIFLSSCNKEEVTPITYHSVNAHLEFNGYGVTDTIGILVGTTSPLTIKYKPSDAYVTNISWTSTNNGSIGMTQLSDTTLSISALSIGRDTINCKLSYKTGAETESTISRTVYFKVVNSNLPIYSAWLTHYGQKIDTIQIHKEDTMSVNLCWADSGAVVKNFSVKANLISIDSFDDSLYFKGMETGSDSLRISIVWINEEDKERIYNCEVPIVVLKERDKTERIKFADKAIEKECVKRWDIDGDDSLSMYEASLVRNLGTWHEPAYHRYVAGEYLPIFDPDSTYTSFDEMKFFVNLDTIPDFAFAVCPTLTSITIPEKVRYIGRYAFSDCDGLKNFNLPNSITYLGSWCFFGAGQEVDDENMIISNFNMPDDGNLRLPINLEYMGERVFTLNGGNTSSNHVTTITFGPNIKEIINMAIISDDCHSRLIFTGDIPPIAWNITDVGSDGIRGWFYGRDIEFYCPDESLEKYNKNYKRVDNSIFTDEVPSGDDVYTVVVDRDKGETYDWGVWGYYFIYNEDNSVREKFKVTQYIGEVVEKDEIGEKKITFTVMKDYLSTTTGKNDCYKFKGCSQSELDSYYGDGSNLGKDRYSQTNHVLSNNRTLLISNDPIKRERSAIFDNSR